MLIPHNSYYTNVALVNMGVSVLYEFYGKGPDFETRCDSVKYITTLVSGVVMLRGKEMVVTDGRRKVFRVGKDEGCSGVVTRVDKPHGD